MAERRGLIPFRTPPSSFPLPRVSFREEEKKNCGGRGRKRHFLALFSPPELACPIILFITTWRLGIIYIFIAFHPSFFVMVGCDDDLGRRHNHAIAAVISAAGISGFVFPLKAAVDSTLLLSTDDSFCSTQNPIPPPEEGI